MPQKAVSSKNQEEPLAIGDSLLTFRDALLTAVDETAVAMIVDKTSVAATPKAALPKVREILSSFGFV